MEIRPCRPEDLRAIHAQPSQYQDLVRFADVLEQQRETFAAQAWTLWQGGVPVAAMGFIEALPGVFEAWAYLGEAAIKSPRSLARSARRGMEEAKRTLDWRRMQAFCVKGGNEYAWLGFLGFRFEGVLKGYGPGGEDMAIFGLVK